MKFVIDLTLAVDAEDIAAAFKTAVGGHGRVEAASIRPAMYQPHMGFVPADGEDIDTPRVEPEPAPEPEKAKPKPEPEEKAEEEKPAPKKKAPAKKKAASKKKAAAKKAEPDPEPEQEPGEEEDTPKVENVSKEALVEAARLYMSRFGAAKTREVLKAFDAAQLREVEEDRWPEVYARLQAELEDS